MTDNKPLSRRGRPRRSDDSVLEKTDKGYKTNRYRDFHRSLRLRYGKATKCENISCTGISKTFDWALREGKNQYSMNMADYQMLCRSCHCKQDMIRGENHCEAKLTEDDVRFIRQNTENLTQQQMAEMFGVMRQTISLVVNRTNWKHVS